MTAEKLNFTITRNNGAERINKDGTPDRRKCNSVKGQSHMVQPFTEDDLRKIYEVLDRAVAVARTPAKLRTACRNRLLIKLGCNVGLRISDLSRLTVDFFKDSSGAYREFNRLQPIKTAKTGKFVTVHITRAVREAIDEYLAVYPGTVEFFRSQKGSLLEERSALVIVKQTAEAAGLCGNYGTHSLRKTFGSMLYHRAANKTEALCNLMRLFNHSSPDVTSAYIGVTENEIADFVSLLDD